jgi:UDP-3-O-[3-hydroxymyristoyl] N-acetylglucosamine deacetylase/3-hydroxyacyl-[acyl-carrier-protein] dehydratase
MTPARRSIAKPATVRGTGLHTGVEVTAKLLPADEGTGVRFRRTDLNPPSEIGARLETVSQSARRTSLGEGDAAVHTVEHVMAAVAAHWIDDLVIELNGPEPPAGDGSAAPYFTALADAGVTEVGGAATVYRPNAPVVVREGEATYMVAPSDQLRLTVTIEWDHPAIGRQSGAYDVTPETFERDLAAARTFGFVAEADALRHQGLALGASLDNTIALSDTSVEGTELRWPDEFVRHKAADLLGDLALLGGRLDAEVDAYWPSHAGNVALARAISRTANRRTPDSG